MAFCLWLFIQPDAIASILGTQDAVKSTESHEVHFLEFLTSPDYAAFERTMLWVVFGAAIAALVYAWMLVGQVKRADTGTDKMKFVADATREGATPTWPNRASGSCRSWCSSPSSCISRRW